MADTGLHKVSSPESIQKTGYLLKSWEESVRFHLMELDYIKEACLEVVSLIFRRIQFTNKFQSHSCEVIINSCWLTGVHVINFCKERWLPQRTFRHWMPANNAELWRLFIVNYNIWHWTRFCCMGKMDHEKIHPTVYGLSSKVETWMLKQNPAF